VASGAQLSQARWELAATSVGNVALFAGGGIGLGGNISRVDIFNVTTGAWTTASLSEPRGAPAATSIHDLALFGGGGNYSISNSRVDIFNSSSGLWTTATLSEACQNLAATSLGKLAVFAGGNSNHTDYYNTVDIYNPSMQQQPSNILIAQNVVAHFSSTTPAVNISAPLVVVGNSSSSSPGHMGLGIMFVQAVASTTTTSNRISSNNIFAMTNATLTRYIYQSHLISATNATQGLLNQVYSFSTTSQQAYSTLVIPPAAVKWSLRINASTPFQDGLNMTFSLSDLSFSTTAKAPSAAANSITHFTTVPYGGSNITRMTTYYLPLLNQQHDEQGQPVAVLEVLDWAIVDGAFTTINHSIAPAHTLSTTNGTLVYTLVLHFPAFNNTLEYDPSMNLAHLLGQQSSSSSPDLGLIIGATVGIGGAIVFVGLVIVTAIVVVIVLAKLQQSKLKGVNFDGSETNAYITNNDQL